MTPIVANFPHSANALPMWVAADRGLFSKRGLAVAFEEARGSAAQYRGLMEGRIHVFTTLMENVIAYRWGEGEVQFDPAPDAVAFMGGGLGHQLLMARASIEDVEGLRGRTLAVSGLRTGNAIVLYGMLSRIGLKRDRDYKVVAVGAGPVTMESLLHVGADAALMGAPHDRTAAAGGLRKLGDSLTVFGEYQSSVYTVRRSWAAAHEEELVALSAAMIEAHRFVFADRADAIAVLRAHLQTLSPDAAAAVYGDLVAPHGGLSRDGRILPQNVEVVLQLRREFAEHPPPPSTLSDFCDTRYHEQAMRLLAKEAS
ncbi:MAG TPA: ABC transporter substrate-binding protein [Stellaceae bacterium]|jgi:ABC-type nitrate/sulfonate/bicarbonate transport system substrate-binding protein